MPDNVHECERCGSPVHQIDIQRGKALKLDKGVLCFGCSDSITPDQKEALSDQVSQKTPPKTPARGSGKMKKTSGRSTRRGTPPPAKGLTTTSNRRVSERRKAASGRASGRPSERRSVTTGSSSRISERRISAGASGKSQSQSGGGSNTILIVGLGGGLLVGVIAAIVLSQSGDKAKPARKRVANSEQTAALASGPPSASSADAGLWATDEKKEVDLHSADLSLKQIRSLVDPSLSRYEDICAALDKLVLRATDTPEADEARTLRAEIDRDYESIADKVLASAIAAAKTMSSRGDSKGAASAFKSVRVQFYGSEWLRTKGEKQIAAALKELGDTDATANAARDEGKPLPQAQQDGEAAADESPVAEVDAWDQFLVDLADAGRESLSKAKTFLTEGKKIHTSKGREFRTKIARLEKLQRDARGVQTLMEDCIGSSKSMLRLSWQDRPYSGKVAGLKNGIVTLKPLHGDPAEIPLDEVSPEELFLASKIMRGGGLGYDRASAYCLVRGDLAAAQKYLKDADIDRTAELTANIDALATAIRSVRRASPLADESDASAVAAASDPDAVKKYELPKSWMLDGEETVAGNPLVVDGKPLWRIDQVWPDDPKKTANYKPLTWDGSKWSARENADGGQPEARVGDIGVRLGTKAASQNSPGQKLAAFSFIAPASDTYNVSGEAVASIWSGGGNVKLLALKLDRKAGTASDIAQFVMSTGRPVTIDVQVSLDEGQELAFVPSYYGMGVAANVSLLSLSLYTGERVAPPTAVAVAGPAGTDAKAAPPQPIDVKYPEEPLPGETGMPGEWAPGLLARVIDTGEKCVAARIDSAPGRIFSAGGPDEAMPVGCRVEWTGWLLLPHKGIYTFEIFGWQNHQMSLDGKSLISGAGKPSPERVYEMGMHPVKFVASEAPCEISLLWMPAGLKKEVIPSDYFFHEVPTPGTAGPPAKLVQGLKAEYFIGSNLERKVAESFVYSTDYDARDLPACGLCPKDRFSIRLSGYLHLDGSEAYEIGATADDGVRVIIDDKPVIDHWLAKNTAPLKATETLEAGLRKFVVEYSENTSAASGSVTVVRAVEAWRVNITPGRLLRDATEPVIVSRKGLVPGLMGRLYSGETPGVGKALLERYDPIMQFRWDGMPPVREMEADRFSGIWTGTLIAPDRGLYHLIVYHDDGVTVRINNTPVINKWNASAGWVSGQVPLRAGPAKIQVSYFNRTAKSGLEIYWSGPTFGFKPLGAGALVCEADELVIAPPWEDAVIIPERVAAAGGPKVLPGQERKPEAPDKPEQPEKPVEKPPEGNLIINGGFEILGEDGKWPERWNAHNWGKESAKYYIRSDQSNPHEGERAVMVRASTAEALPGVFSAVKSMPPGKYELRFWACADVDVKARVHAHLAGMDFDTTSVGEEWVQLKFTVEIKEKKQTNVPIRIWTSTAKAKVWFDDVEVEHAP